MHIIRYVSGTNTAPIRVFISTTCSALCFEFCQSSLNWLLKLDYLKVKDKSQMANQARAFKLNVSVRGKIE